jgi:leucyl aminopeptidase
MFFSWLCTVGKKSKKNSKSKLVRKAHIYVLSDENRKLKNDLVARHSSHFEKQQLEESSSPLIHFKGHEGPVWIMLLPGEETHQHNGLLSESGYSRARDFAGLVVSQMRTLTLTGVDVHLWGTDELTDLGFLTGLEASLYSYREFGGQPPQILQVPLSIKKTEHALDLSLIERAQVRGQCLSLARHLVNLPPNEKTPSKFSAWIKKLKLSKSSRVTIWKGEQLKKHKCELLYAVGKGSPDSAQLVHISYRPKKKSNKKPVALVGKGVTFDTGGLDIKPAQGMRLMKKDIGGAASILALAYWADQMKYEHPLDFYLALAENAVDGHSMRPGDVYRSRAGYLVEIDNTDAEGRLVLADALDVAAEKNPEVIINLATLTGACRVALGVELAGLFCNNDELAQELTEAGQLSGDPNWRLPLVDRYFSSYSSPFADFKNSGESFGGAILAALFLQKFVKNIKWAHLDMYSWTDRPNGIFQSAGGNAQSVQALIHWLEKR